MTWGVESAEMEEDEFDDNGFPSYDSSAQVPEESFENQSLLPLESINVEGCNDGDQEDRLSVKEEEDDGEDDNGVDPSLVCDDGSNATELHSSTQEKHEDSGGTTQDFREQDDTSKLDSTNKNHVTVEGSINAVNCDVAEALSSFQEDFDDLAFTEKGGVSSRPTSDETNVEECIRGSEKTPDDERSLTQKTQDEKQPGEDAEFVFLDADSGVLPATTAIEEDASSRTAVPAGGTEEFDPGPSRDDRKITREPDEGSSDVVDSGSSSEDDSNLSTKSGKGSRVSTKWNFLPTLFLFCILAFNGGVAALTVIPGDVLASSGSIARLRCSTDHSSPVYWERRLFGSDEQETIYYGKNGLARIAGDRISVDEDSTSGRYDLVISNVQLEDAGTYTCIDEAGIGEGYPAELVVSERFTCEMPVPRYGFMGENIFDIPEDPVESTCSLAFRGNVVPRFQWTWGKLSRLVTPTVINGSTVTSSVTLRATHDLNGARLTCLPVVSTGATSLDETPRWISESVLVRSAYRNMAERRSGDLNEQIAEIAECPICTDKIQNNRLLPCGHTFCLRCLEQYKRATKAKGKSLTCPVCRREFGIPKGGCGMFPKNIIVEKLLEFENSSKNESDVRLCDTCDKENKTSAVVDCIECEQSLCSECEKLHGKLNVSAAHHVVPVSKTSQFKDVPKRSFCEEHSEYTLELMCYDCNKTICWKCCSLSHANHKSVDMKEIATDYCEQLQSNIVEIDSRLSLLSKIIVNINDQEKRYRDNFEKEKATVSKTGAELVRSVVSNEDRLIRQLSSTLQRNLKSLQPQKEKVQEQIDSLKQHKASVEHLKESGNSVEIVSRTEKLHSKAHQLLSSSIININEPILSTMTESEIQKHLIASSVAPTNGSAGARRASSDSGCFSNSETSNDGASLSSNGTAEGMGSSQKKTPQLNSAATSTSQTITDTNSKGKSLPPATPMKPEQRRSQSLRSPHQNDLSLNVATTSTSQTITDTNSKDKSLPPATPMKPEQRRSQSLRSPPQNDMSLNVTTYPASAEATNPAIYGNLPPVTPAPPPQLPPRSNLPSTQSASDRNTQSAKVSEQQTSAKDVDLPITTNIGSPSVASFSVGSGAAALGVAVYKQKIYVATENSPEINVYSSDEHIFLHTLVVPGLKQASDLTFCRRNSCLYLIDWIVRSIFRVEIEGGKEITNWSTDREFGALSVSGDGSVILAGHETNSLKEYTTMGKLTRTVKLKSDVGESIRPWHAVKLASEKFVVSHGSSSDTALHRVCLVDSEGQIIKAFGGLRGRGNNSLWGPYHLCVTDESKLFIADCNNGRIVVLDENLEFVDEISGTGILRKPRRICLDKTSNKLFATDNKLVAKKASDGRIVIISQVL